MPPEAIVNSDGSVLVNGLEISVPNVRMEELIGVGANGLVFRAHHLFLERELAVKIWLTNKKGDRRDKFIQGIEEARKTANIGEGRRVIHIYDAGTASGVFYATMDYYRGITLAEWLRSYSPKLMRRVRFAAFLNSEVFHITSETSFHGDLHTNNVLIKVDDRGELISVERSHSPDFMIIDFGTSRFTSRGYSLRRHWQVFNETIVSLLNFGGHFLSLRRDRFFQNRGFSTATPVYIIYSVSSFRVGSWIAGQLVWCRSPRCRTPAG